MITLVEVRFEHISSCYLLRIGTVLSLKLVDSDTAVRTLHLITHLVHSEELAVHVSCTSCRAVIVVTGKVDIYESRTRSEKHRFLMMVVI